MLLQFTKLTIEKAGEDGLHPCVIFVLYYGDADDVVALYTNSTELLELKSKKVEGKGVNMCQAIKEMLQNEREEGRAEERKNTERERKKAQEAVLALCKEDGATKEQTINQLMDKCELDMESAERLIGE